MLNDNEKTFNILKVIYFDIINGFSVDEETGIFVKHLTEKENAELIRHKLFLIDKFQKDGIPSYEEKLTELIKEGIWSNEDEDKIIELKYHITDNEKFLSKTIPEQWHILQKIIDQKKSELHLKLLEKRELMGRTAEDFANKNSENYFIFLSLYKDEKLKLFNSYKDFENLEESEIDNYSNLMEKCLSKIKEENIQKISVMPFFLNSFAYAKDRIEVFLNRPISEITPYQLYLISCGQKNINVLEKSEGTPPDLLVGNVNFEDVIKWYDSNYSRLKGKVNPKDQVGVTTSTKEIITTRHV